MDYYKDKLEILLKGLMILILLMTSARRRYSDSRPRPGLHFHPGSHRRCRRWRYHPGQQRNLHREHRRKQAAHPAGQRLAGGSGSAITLSANRCTLQGFVARESDYPNAGIMVTSISNTISGNTATGNINGILI